MYQPLRIESGIAGAANAASRAIVNFATRVFAEQRRRRLGRATYLTLNSLDDRALRDIGFSRSEIGSVAAEIASDARCTRIRSRLTCSLHC